VGGAEDTPLNQAVLTLFREPKSQSKFVVEQETQEV
jgi:hypothetical protein